jgi:phosphoribosylformimino-5-aminoimidazole carboxamide ribotide isomerase
MQIIPAIDIINGQCVRLTKGDYNQKKIYNDNPVAVAKEFEQQGAKRLHVVDLDGAKAGKLINIDIVAKIAAQTNLVIDYGGGIKTEADIKLVIDAGIDLITIGSLAAKQPEMLSSWVTKYGADRFFIGADVLNKEIKVSGWLEGTGLQILPFLKTLLDIGITNVFCTDISKDGMEQGPSFALYKEILLAHPTLALVASGGVGSTADVDALGKIGLKGAIIGKAFYEGNLTMTELKKYA